MVHPISRTSAAYTNIGKTPAAYDPSASRKLAALRALHRKSDAQDPQVARQAAALLTSQLFFAPLLAEMRKLPFGKEIGHGGRLEEAFGEQLDQHLADVVARTDRGLTEQIARRLTRGPRAASLSPTGQRAQIVPVQAEAQLSAADQRPATERVREESAKQR